MTDSDLAERRFYRSGYPSEASREEEIRQALRDYVYHDSMVRQLGRYKGFFHIIERKRLGEVLQRYGVV